MQQSGLRIVNEAELAKHSTVDSLWVAVHGLVYDLTTFDKHPGGKSILIKHAGTDATKFFIGHSSRARQMMEKIRMEQPELQVVGAGELARHSSVNSLWVAVHGLVYDLTGFIDEHPGGKDVLINNAGTDATNFFEYLGHTSRARQMMKKYLIGRLVT